VSRAAGWLGAVGAGAGLLALPWLAGSYAVYLTNLVAINVILAVGLVLVTGLTGQLSLGNAAFFAVGAYVSTLATVSLGLPYAASLLLGAAAASVIGVLVGLPALRLEGLYLALATLGLGKAIQLVILHWKGVTNGASGLAVPRPVLLGIPLASDTHFFYLITAVTIGLLWVARNIVRSGVGRALLALRDSTVAAECAGINLARYKTLSFALGAAYSGLAGGLHAPLVGFIEPEEYGIWASISYLIMIAVGGMTTLTGGVVGAVILTLLPEVLRWSQEFKELIFGGLLLLVLLVMPGGIVGALSRLAARLAGARRQPSAPPGVPGAAAAPADRRAGGPALAGGGAGRLMVAVDGVTVRFGGLTAVDDLSFGVATGEAVALIGPNGAGKTTVLNVVNGLGRPTGGAVRLLGQDVIGWRPDRIARGGVGRTFQRVQLFPAMTALDNVLVGLHAVRRVGLGRTAFASARHRREERELRDRAWRVLEAVGLAAAATAAAGTLPFGHQRLLELARAMAAEPRLLLLDEPASGLNPDEATEFIGVLRTIRRASGVTILIVEHVMPVVQQIADRIVVLHYGRKIAEGPFDTVKREPAVVEAYLGGVDGDAESVLQPAHRGADATREG
jgi:ABC-type branched-subunit amino acid transport system ATPase component/ABC-type branched-subunit amino acid transport system permease subunit